MKTTLTFILVVILLKGQAQNLTGRWKGQMSAEGESAPSTLTLRQSGNTLTGSVVLIQNGGSETHQLSGQANGNMATGTLIVNGVGLAFELQVTGEQLALAIGLLGQAFLRGQYARSTANSSATAPARTQLQATGVAAQWEQAFRGRRLFRHKVQSFLSFKWYYDFCSNGFYSYREESQTIGEYSMSSAESEQGTWRVVMRGSVAYLECSPQNKAPSLRPIASLAQGQVSLDGQRFSLDTNQNCQ